MLLAPKTIFSPCVEEEPTGSGSVVAQQSHHHQQRQPQQQQQQQLDDDSDNNNNNSSTRTAIAQGNNDESTAPQQQQQATTTPTATATQPRPNNNSNRPPALWKSPRLKGYLTLVLASIINYNAAYHSNDAIFNNAIASTPIQQRYAKAVSLVSAILSAVALLAHLDRYSPLQKVWRTIFQSKSRLELALLLFFVIWWSIATGIQTSIRGVAGDGKGQYNLYFSSWVCALTCIWMLERWWVSFGWSSFSTFLSSWPHRAPGWMAMTFMSLFTLIWYIDLYKNWRNAPEKNGVLLLYQNVHNSQWEWLLFITGFTILPGMTFVLIELFRQTATEESSSSSSPTTPATAATGIVAAGTTAATAAAAASLTTPTRNVSATATTTTTPMSSVRRRLSESVVVRPIITVTNDGKGAWENIIEGICLFVLVLAWIPTVVFATSPGGIASLVGNSYFFTWATSVFVTETTVWWIHDWRKTIHSALAKQARDYQQKQLQVLRKSQQIQQRAAIAAAKHLQQQQQQQHLVVHAGGDNGSSSDDDNNNEDDDDVDFVNNVEQAVLEPSDNYNEKQKSSSSQPRRRSHPNQGVDESKVEEEEEEAMEDIPISSSSHHRRRRSISFSDQPHPNSPTQGGEPEGSEFFDALEEITDGI